MKKILCFVVLCAVFVTGTVLYAQDAQKKLLSKRAAELDAYRKLAEIIKGFKIDSETTVKDFVTESDTIHTHFRHFIKGAEMVGSPRYFDDGTCEVDMRITLERVVTELKRIVKRYYKGTRYKDVAFEDIKKRVEQKVVQVTGAGIPRTEKQLPAKYRDEYIDPTPSRRSPWAGDPLWSKVPAVVRLKVKRAAEVLAYRSLAEMVKGFQITSETTVKDFMTEGDIVVTQLRTHLRFVKINKYTYRPDGVIEAEVELTLERMVTELRAVKKRFYKGNRYKDVVFEDVKKYTERKIVKAIGEAPLPEKYLGIVEESEPEPEEKPSVVEKAPDWAGKVLKAKGQGLPPEDVDSEADAYIKAKRAAELMALRKLAEMLDGVQLTSDTTVKNFKTESDIVKGEVETFLAGFRTVSEKLLEDEITVEVEVELHLGELLKIWKKYKKK
jgi:hypothetical protein